MQVCLSADSSCMDYSWRGKGGTLGQVFSHGGGGGGGEGGLEAN
jgi:hypothetical protein